MKRVAAVIGVGNDKSAKLAERCGMEDEGIARSYCKARDGGTIDCHIYATIG